MRKIFSLAGLLIIIVISGWLVYYFYQRYVFVITDDAIQTADITNVSTQDVSGKIIKMFKKEFSPVKKGGKLFKIEDKIYKKEVESLTNKLSALMEKEKSLKIKLERIKEQLPANYKAIQKELLSMQKILSQLKKQYNIEKTNYESSVKKAKSVLESAQRQLEASKKLLENTKKKYGRYKRLFLKKIIARELFESVETSYFKAMAEYSSALSNLKVASENLNIAMSLKNKVLIIAEKEKEIKEKIKALEEKLIISRAALKQIKELNHEIKRLSMEIESLRSNIDRTNILLSHTLVLSPINGLIAKKWKQEGDFVSPGLPVYSIYDPKSFYILAWVEENRINNIHIGNTAYVEPETCSGRFNGKVYAIGTSAGSVFSLIPRDTSQGEYTKVTQRVPVKIKLDNFPPECIKPGTNVTVYIKKNDH